MMEERIRQLETENQELRSKIEFYEQDGIVGWYFTINSKMNEMISAVRGYTVKLDKNDKGFERFWKTVTENGELAASLLSLEKLVKERLGVVELKEEEQANAKLPNYMEQYIKEKGKKK